MLWFIVHTGFVMRHYHGTSARVIVTNLKDWPTAKHVGNPKRWRRFQVSPMFVSSTKWLPRNEKYSLAYPKSSHNGLFSLLRSLASSTDKPHAMFNCTFRIPGRTARDSVILDIAFSIFSFTFELLSLLFPTVAARCVGSTVIFWSPDSTAPAHIFKLHQQVLQSFQKLLYWYSTLSVFIAVGYMICGYTNWSLPKRHARMDILYSPKNFGQRKSGTVRERKRRQMFDYPKYLLQCNLLIFNGILNWSSRDPGRLQWTERTATQICTSLKLSPRVTFLLQDLKQFIDLAIATKRNLPPPSYSSQR